MSEKPAGDEDMGIWIYCGQHLRPHTTGWCTVSTRDKRQLKARNYPDAVAECKALGLTLSGIK